MRNSYEKCKKHDRSYCTDYVCKQDEVAPSNAGSASINTDGHLAIGIGSGLAIDTSDGSLGIQVGGITIDTGN